VVVAGVITAGLLFQNVAASGDNGRPDVTQLVLRHIAAIGGTDAIRKLRDFELHLVYTEDSFSAESSLAQARPYFRLVRVPAGPLTRESVVEGYDGSPWEYYGDPGVVLRTVAGAGAVSRRNAHQFIDPLVDASANGTTLTYDGERSIDGKTVLVVKTRFSDGTQELIFLDRTDYLIAGFAENIPFHAFGRNVSTHFAMSDYRPVGGVLMPFRTAQVDDASGKLLDSSVTTSARANIGLPPSYFAPPPLTLTPLQQMISSLYEEREDADAVVQTYRDYRSEYGVTPSSLEAVNFIGYQCLKMGSTKTAIAVLGVNVEYYQNSASAHFGLGRALASAGETGLARNEFARALEIDPSFKKAADALAALP
jgi:hypothetical protein